MYASPDHYLLPKFISVAIYFIAEIYYNVVVLESCEVELSTGLYYCDSLNKSQDHPKGSVL